MRGAKKWAERAESGQKGLHKDLVLIIEKQ